jgi:hypothetical protein
MKNLSKIFLSLFTLAIASCSVEDVQDRPIIEATDAPVLTAPSTGAIYEITPANSGQLFDRFTWTAANFGGDVLVKYEVELASLDDKAFAKPQLVQSSNSNNVAVTGENLNKAAIALGVTPFVSTSVLARVKAVVGTQSIGSEPIEIAITAFKTAPLIAAVGDHQGWADKAGVTFPFQMKPSAKGNADFEGYIYLNGGFKLLEADDNLVFDFNKNVAYGKSADDGKLDAKGGNLTAAAGYYLIKADTQKLTYSTTLTKWGIIGDATPGGWDADTALTYDPVKYVWTGTIVLKGTGKLKFRANGGWDINFGSDKADGIANAGGADIPTPGAGTYKITLDLSHSRAYTYKLEKQ